MPRSIGIFDTSIGIQSVLSNEAGNENMPPARPLATTVMAEAGLGELYLPNNADRMIEAALCPEVGDGTILQPDVFTANLQGSLAALQDSRNADVRAFARKDLAPMLEDTALLQAYVGLMVGG
ncbi:MAG: type III secretion protein [Desulfovibrio sp.]|jgi:type III secretion protein X|nr:type III secretion protein [Desulfovibrio sp.]